MELEVSGSTSSARKRRSTRLRKAADEQGEEQGGGGALSVRMPVYLNVYDLSPINGYMYWVGLGMFHSGIEVHGVEYSFGAHDFSSSGVFEVIPRSCPGYTFRKAMVLGSTELSAGDVRELIERMSIAYTGDSYHLILRNCNHFTNEVSLRLTGCAIPGWVNRLANIGMCSFGSCIMCYRLRVHHQNSSPPPMLALKDC
ncbi:deSI-like protein At4g17486 [Selaginella moellendorffii]|uniref:deSI-like protein At4g17486 n=1 Tax=Selaginella moellendorffii TaxID=88036 RepID=UPI000D1C589F|nr:deSI-like protein At4g17486 [Selaginella moellendorffii]XP_024531037.1 deSI-like protein At4g17486 [Selaginella moellendorffii]|eukprot:XP_002970161.2 deSI-like protein At4g17486 [Selaginella moellendorffii]